MKIIKQIKLNYLSDLFFIFISFFFLFYGIFIYFRKNFSLTLILSILCATSICVIYLALNLKEKPLSKKELKNKIEKFNSFLSFEEKTKIVEILKNFYLLKFENVDFDGEKLTIKGVKSVIYPLLTIEPTTAKQIRECHNSTPKNYKTIILSTSYTEKALEFANYLKNNLSLYNASDIYFSLRNAKMLPDFESHSSLQKRKVISVLKGIFKKEKAGRFIFFGVSLSFSAIYSFFPLYYLIFGSLLILIGVYLKLFVNPSLNEIKGIDNV